MNFYVLTLFPEMIMQGLNTSIIGRALEKGLLTLQPIDIRDFSENKHNRVDDYPYGGGAGMVMAPGPVYRAYQYIQNQIESRQIESNQIDSNQIDTSQINVNQLDFSGLDSSQTISDISQNLDVNQNTDLNQNSGLSQSTDLTFSKSPEKKIKVIYLTPQGKVFNQKMAEDLAGEEDLIFLCGHYEGIDERVLEMIVTDYVSIGDYVLTGGELPAMVMIDTIARLVPGVLNNDVSAEFESLQDNLLEYPQYTRPENFMEKKVPEVLLSGHHAKIEEWRRSQSVLRTAKNRPDLLDKAVLTPKEQALVKKWQEEYKKYLH